MPELRGLLKNNRGPWSEGIIRFNAPFHCFRTSRSLLWPLKWNSRLLFVIMTSCSTSVTCPFHLLKIITCSKQWEGALKRHRHNANSVIGSLMSLLILCILFCFFFFSITYAYMCRWIRACLHGGGGPQLGEVIYGGSPHLSCKRDQIKMRD